MFDGAAFRIESIIFKTSVISKKQFDVDEVKKTGERRGSMIHWLHVSESNIGIIECNIYGAAC